MKITQEAEARNLEYLKLIEDKSSAKDKLLLEYDKEQVKEKNLDLKTLLNVYLIVIFVLALALPKIYISNQIYYISKDINKKYHEYLSLKEEQEYLKNQLEAMRFQHQVLDDL